MNNHSQNAGRSGSPIWERIRPVLPLAILCGLAELGYSIVNILALPVFVSREMGIGEHVGLIMGAFLFSEAVGRLGLGALCDYFGRRPLIVCGPLLSAAASLLLIKAGGLFPAVAIRILDGIGAAAFWPALFAAAGDTTRREDRSTAMGFLNVAYMVGLAFGPLAGGSVNRLAGNYHAAFHLSAALFLIIAPTALLFVPKKAFVGVVRTPEEEDSPALHGVANLLHSSRRVWRLLLIALTTFAGIGILIPVVELYALDRYGIDQRTFGALFLAPAVVIGLAAVPLGRLGDTLGRLPAIKWGMLMCAAALAVVPLVNSYLILAGGAIIVGLGFLLAFPAWMALLTDLTEEKSRGSVLGAAGLAQGVGAIMGAYFGGKIYHMEGLVLGIPAQNAPVYLASALLGLSLLLTLLLFRTSSSVSVSS